MRFPLVRSRLGEYENASGALVESLMDYGAIDPITGDLRQSYFDLNIEEGPVLRCLQDFFDLVPRFHVGCTLDQRPPSFDFDASRGSNDTKEGQLTFGYRREIKWDVFARNGSFRTEEGYRDLNRLAAAYNDRANYVESVRVGCSWWSGNYIGEMKVMHFGDSIFFVIDNGNAKLDRQKPKDGSLLPKVIEGTGLANLGDGFTAYDVIFGMMKAASKFLPIRIGLEANKQRIEEACECYL